MLTKLNALIDGARVSSWLADADWPAEDPESYRKHRTQRDERRLEAIRHAERMVLLGLLTEPQAAFVLQHYLVDRQWRVLHDHNVQELLGMTESQKQKLVEVAARERSKESRLNLMSVDPQEQKQNQARLAAITNEYNSGLKDVLTARQLQQWSRLTAEQPALSEPRNLPALQGADVEELSPTFDAIEAEGSHLDLSADQKRLLKELEEVARVGLLWIKARADQPVNGRGQTDSRDNRISQLRAEFLMHAEQVALEGILTENQAEKIRAAMNKT